MVIFLNIQVSQAGVIVGATRVIFYSSNNESEISVKNPESKMPYLIQSWIESVDNTKPLFITLPPLLRIEPGQENLIRIISTRKDYPQDRESVYWLNIKSIASTQPLVHNQLQISVKTRIKVFVRPQNLTASAAENAYKSLQFNFNHGVLKITNPTPFYVSFFSIKVDQTQLDDIYMIAPFSTINNQLKKGNSVKWSAINDYGGVTPERQVSL